ncbi:NAD(P)/FAD-dependent oxidoreductase [Craurococcus roseus]|uniref:Thioredoxin reductase n=1 Tax=Craurococcus roseus TaxID=77585 RepID=A0ABP3Q4B2_9PROT
MDRAADDGVLDCLVIGGGPAGLTAAIYLGRFGRRFLVVDAGEPRAAWIPVSHNIPFFGEGIPGPRILERQREHAGRYGTRVLPGTVTELRKAECGGGLVGFVAAVEERGGARRTVEAKRVLLATGSVDVEPDLPDLPDAVRRGLVRYCPICDGYEARGRRIAVIGHGKRGAGEAGFIARTYGGEVTLLTLGRPMDDLELEERERLEGQGVKIVEQPIAALDVRDGQIAALRTGGGQELRFEVLYSALGLEYRTGLALALGAEHDAQGALAVDAHNQTTVKGLYAAGDVARGLDQIVVAMGHAAVAATHIHNRCELPTEDEPDEARQSRTG